MSQRIRMTGAVLLLLLLGGVLSACGSSPVAENWPGLTVDGNTIYAISGKPQQVYMLDADTGVQKGTFVPQGVESGLWYWSPVVQGEGEAYVGFAEPNSGYAALYAFDPETGQELWKVPAETLIIPAPVYADGAVYFGSSDGKVYAVDVEEKRIKPGWPFQADEAIWGSPLIAGDRLYVAAQDHHVYCLDAESGEVIWEFQAGGAMAAQPILNEETGILYVGAFNGQLYAVNAETGESLPGFEFLAGNWIWSETLLGGDRIYVTALDGKLYALDPASGSVLPGYPFDSGQIDEKDDVLRAAPVQGGGHVIVASETGRVIATNNAVTQWYWPTGVPQAAVLTTPVVSGETVYVILMNGQVQALNAESGVPGWTFTPPES